jgi:hypothetical protein
MLVSELAPACSTNRTSPDAPSGVRFKVPAEQGFLCKLNSPFGQSVKLPDYSFLAAKQNPSVFVDTNERILGCPQKDQTRVEVFVLPDTSTGGERSRGAWLVTGEL